MLRRIILLLIYLSLLSISVTDTLSWQSWTRNNYKNICAVSAGTVSVAFLCYMAWQECRPKTPEECYEQAKSLLDTLHSEYDAKITVFEQAYKITGDITSKQEQFEHARQQWCMYIDEELLCSLKDFSSSWHAEIVTNVRQLSRTKIDLSKKRRECLQENNLLLAKQLEQLSQELSLLLLQLSFLEDCIEYNGVYFDLISMERKLSTEYVQIINSFMQQKDLAQVICSKYQGMPYAYVTFVLSLNKNIKMFTEKINQARNAIRSTQLFQRSKRLQVILCIAESYACKDNRFRNELYAYQEILIERVSAIKDALIARANRLCLGKTRTEYLQLYWNICIAHYRFCAMHDLNNYPAGAKQDALKLELEEKFMKMQADTLTRCILEANEVRHQTELLFDTTIHISLTEELHFQNMLEKMLEDANVLLRQ